MSFLHGVETIEYQTGPRKVETIATAVIGLIGSAPIHLLADASKKTVNAPVLITNDKDAAAFFGPDTTGYTIPAAIAAILAQGAGPIVVVNVFDPSSPAHQTTGNPDPSKVGAADIIGTTKGDGTRTGLMAMLDVKPTYGFAPKQLIAPGYTGLTGVMGQLDSIATKLRAIAYVDAATGLSPAQAIAARSTTLNTSSKRIMICYPAVKAVDGSGNTVLRPMSQFVAGACAAKDIEKGYWWSPSNTEMKGVVGLERPIDGSFQDINADLNLLNAAGIMTTYSGYGTGYRVWGNRSAAYPGSSDPDTFMAVRRTADVIEESLELACFQYVDAPITQALVDQILDDANAFLRVLIGRGAVVDGKAFFDAAKNPSSQLAGGHLTLGYRFMPPAPLERLTFEAYLDVNLYSNAIK
jgi:hypothetical protein